MSQDGNLTDIGNTLNVSSKQIMTKPEENSAKRTKNKLQNALTGLVKPKEKDFRDHLIQQDPNSR